MNDWKWYDNTKDLNISQLILEFFNYKNMKSDDTSLP